MPRGRQRSPSQPRGGISSGPWSPCSGPCLRSTWGFREEMTHELLFKHAQEFASRKDWEVTLEEAGPGGPGASDTKEGALGD